MLTTFNYFIILFYLLFLFIIIYLFFFFEWNKIFKSADDKLEVKCDLKLRPNKYSGNVNVLANILKTLIEVVDFLKIDSKMQQLVRYSLQKTD